MSDRSICPDSATFSGHRKLTTGASMFKGITADLYFTGEMSHVSLPLRLSPHLDHISAGFSPLMTPGMPSTGFASHSL